MPLTQWRGTTRTSECSFSAVMISCWSCMGFLERSFHPCLWCEAAKEQTRKSPTEQPVLSERTPRSIKSDLRKCKSAGSKKKTAKAYNNVVHSPIWDIELTHVAPSYYHLLLGIATKHHDLLERDCHYLDKQIAQSLAKEETPKPHRHQPRVQDKRSAFSEASSSRQNGLDR